MPPEKLLSFSFLSKHLAGDEVMICLVEKHVQWADFSTHYFLLSTY